jgi:HSP20 family molecular chaperone IbpA
MSEHDTKELKLREKQEVTTPVEQSRPGVVFSPNVDIYETDSQIVVLADLPGVKSEDLNIDLRDSVLTISADVAPFENQTESALLMEYQVGKYMRQFTLSETIDQQRIDAQLKDGVLRLSLPKVEKAQPRTIQVTAG